MFLHKVFSSEVYLDFQKDRAKWQNSVSNRQRLTSRLPMLFTKDVTIKNKFCQAFLNKLSHSKNLDTKNERMNPFEMKFTMINCKIKKDQLNVHSFYHDFINKGLTVALRINLVISVCYMKLKNLIVCQIKLFCFFYNSLAIETLGFTVG